MGGGAREDKKIGVWKDIEHWDIGGGESLTVRTESSAPLSSLER